MDSRYSLVAFFISMSMFLLGANTGYVSIDVFNGFHSGNRLQVSVITGNGHRRAQETVAVGKNMSWSLGWGKAYNYRVEYICIAEQVLKDSETKFIGSVLVFSAAWHFGGFTHESEIKYKWLFDEEGAAIYDSKIARYHLVHPWKLEFFVVNNFESQQEIELVAVDDEGHQVKGTIPFAEDYHWIHQLHSGRSLEYTCHVHTPTAEISFPKTFRIYISSLHENPLQTTYVRTAYWYRVNESGVEMFNFNSGHYEWGFGWGGN